MREEKPSSRRKAPKRGKPATKSLPSTLELVRKGVRRFILEGTTLAEFRKAMRLGVKKGRLSANPMPAGAFRKIVRDAVAERKQNIKERPRRQKTRIKPEDRRNRTT